MLLEPRLRLEYIVLRAIIGLVRLMPLDTAVAISAKLWRVLAPYGKRHRRALANLALAYPEKTEAERRAIALAMWENLGRVMAETMQLDRLLADPGGSKLPTGKLLDRYGDKFGAAVGVSLHTGNWELSIYPFAYYGCRAGGGVPQGQKPLRRPVPARPAPRTLSRRAARQGPRRTRLQRRGAKDRAG